MTGFGQAHHKLNENEVIICQFSNKLPQCQNFNMYAKLNVNINISPLCENYMY